MSCIYNEANFLNFLVLFQFVIGHYFQPFKKFSLFYQKSGAQKVSGQDGSRKVAVVLEVTPRGIEQLHPSSGAVIASYHFVDMDSLVPVSDIAGGIAIKVGNVLKISALFAY